VIFKVFFFIIDVKTCFGGSIFHFLGIEIAI